MTYIDLINNLFLKTPELFWQITALVSFWLLAILYHVIRTNRLLIIILVGAYSLLASVLVMWYYQVHSCRWVSLTQPTTLYAGPSPRYHTVGHGQARQMFCIVKRDQHWMCVDNNEVKGWLPIQSRMP